MRGTAFFFCAPSAQDDNTSPWYGRAFESGVDRVSCLRASFWNIETLKCCGKTQTVSAQEHTFSETLTTESRGDVGLLRRSDSLTRQFAEAPLAGVLSRGRTFPLCKRGVLPCAQR